MNPAQSSVILPSPAAPFAPQKAPMFLVDTLLSVTGGDAVAEACVRKEWPFVDDSGALDDLAFLELIAQTFAAVRGYSASDSSSRVGYLVGAKHLRILGQARAGDRLRIRVSPVGEIGGFVVVQGEVHANDELLASGQIKVFVPQEGSETK